MKLLRGIFISKWGCLFFMKGENIMLKKTITYTDYDGNERTEDFHFNINEAELTEMEMTTEGGFAEMLDRIVKAKDAPAIIKEFKTLILKAYGEKSPDGRRFVKSEELSQEFSQTEAYSKLFMELATDANMAADFVNGVIPNVDSHNTKTASPGTVE